MFFRGVSSVCCRSQALFQNVSSTGSKHFWHYSPLLANNPLLKVRGPVSYSMASKWRKSEILCIHTCTRMCLHIIYIHIYIYYLYTCIFMYVCAAECLTIYTCVCTYITVCMYTKSHIRVHIHTHTYTYSCLPGFSLWFQHWSSLCSPGHSFIPPWASAFWPLAWCPPRQSRNSWGSL